MNASSPTVFPLGDSCYCLTLGEGIDPELSRHTLNVYRHIKTDSLLPAGVLDVIPTYRSIGIHFDPLVGSAEDIRVWLEGIGCSDHGWAEEGQDGAGEVHHILVEYSGEDLRRVGAQASLTSEEVVERHTQSIYTVAMIGFVPHFPYLLGLDPALTTPRLKTHRSQVPAGSVAIGGSQTGIYPSTSPGGWNLIGMADPASCLPLRPGDTVKFTQR